MCVCVAGTQVEGPRQRVSDEGSGDGQHHDSPRIQRWRSVSWSTPTLYPSHTIYPTFYPNRIVNATLCPHQHNLNDSIYTVTQTIQCRQHSTRTIEHAQHSTKAIQYMQYVLRPLLQYQAKLTEIHTTDKKKWTQIIHNVHVWPKLLSQSCSLFTPTSNQPTAACT